MFWKIFTFPGRVIAWFGYMFPKKGDVWASARRVDNPAVHLLFSLFVYGLIGFGAFMGLTERSNASASREEIQVTDSAGESSRTVEVSASGDPELDALLSASGDPELDALLSAAEATVQEPVATENETATEALSEMQERMPVANAQVAKPPQIKESAASASRADVQRLSPSNTPSLRRELVRLLDSGPNENRGAWSTENINGEVSVAPWRRTGDGICRQYSFTVRSTDDTASSGSREACRIGGGPWNLAE